MRAIGEAILESLFPCILGIKVRIARPEPGLWHVDRMSAQFLFG